VICVSYVTPCGRLLKEKHEENTFSEKIIDQTFLLWPIALNFEAGTSSFLSCPPPFPPVARGNAQNAFCTPV
jgi:hypothetical protein